MTAKIWESRESNPGWLGGKRERAMPTPLRMFIFPAGDRLPRRQHGLARPVGGPQAHHPRPPLADHRGKLKPRLLRSQHLASLESKLK